MRICIISREYPPETGWGGIATFAKHLAHGLTDLGHQVEVISLAVDKPHSIRESGILVHRVRQLDLAEGMPRSSAVVSYTRYALGCSAALWKKFIELHNKRPFDIVDTPELLAEGIWPAITKTAPLAVRLYTPHSKFIAERLHNVKPSLDHQMVAAIERVAMLNADILTSPSEDLADFVSLDLSYPRERIKIIRNPIDPDVFSPEGSRAFTRNPKATILFVGRLEERKGIHYFIDAIPQIVAQCTEVRFIIVGDDTNTAEGQRSVQRELQAKVAQHGVESYIQWVPRVGLDALPSYYRSADICVVPSVYDNSPYTCLEAMSCGKAVVGTSAGGTREYIETGKSGVIVPPRDAESLATAILSLVQDEARREEIGKAARERVLTQFHRQEIARQTLELYEEAIANFAKRADHKLYRRDATLLCDDLDEFLGAFDECIYDIMFLDPAYRVVHYFRLLCTRPKLFAGKVVLAILQKLFGAKASSVSFVQKLQAEIAEKGDRRTKRSKMPGAQEKVLAQTK